jgi:hypothetical protein
MVTSLTLHKSPLLEHNTLMMIGKGSLVPKLKNLVCNVIDLKQALDMLESRYKDYFATTIDATIFHRSPYKENDAERVAVLRNYGLDITLERVPLAVVSDLDSD